MIKFATKKTKEEEITHVQVGHKSEKNKNKWFKFEKL